MELIEKIFGVVTANKIKMFLSEYKILKYATALKNFLENAFKSFVESSDMWKAVMVFILFSNLFLFSSLISFVIVFVLDFCLLKYIQK